MHSLHTFITVVLVASAASAGVLPRQAQSSLECNAARINIVRSLIVVNNNVQQIEDPATQQAAQAGVDEAVSGIQTIGQAIAAGEAPPAEARDITGAGLQATGEALAAGDATDPAVAAAQENLNAAVQAGEDVVALC